MQRTNGHISFRIYELLLFAYPSDFRRNFGAEMLQVFRDCYRTEPRGSRVVSNFRLWLRTVVDLVVSAVKEHVDKENSFMNTFTKNLIAVGGCVLIIVFALVLLSYGRKHGVSSILAFGYFLDALATMGIVGNIIVFLLAKIAKLDSLRVAVRTFLVVHAATLLLLVFVAGRNDQRFNIVSIAIGYVGSFLFWTGLYWVWSKTTQTWSHGETNG